MCTHYVAMNEETSSIKKALFGPIDDVAVNNGFFSGKLDAGKAPLNIPKISLPKGGGAIKGIDEKFEVNAVDGTSSFSMSLPITPGRNGFRPSLSLTYNSGAGNSPFGLGWNVDLPFIQRRTSKKLPEYKDAEESDVFMLSGAEDLQPFLGEEGRYRPRVESNFSRIERILHPEKGMYWKVTTGDNVVTVFGVDAGCRIANPGNADRIFKWLPCFTYNDKGDWISYEYKEENTENVPDSLPEKNRLNGRSLFTNRYLWRVKYGNRLPYYPQGDCRKPEGEYFFELVFDYDGSCRPDPFSDYHAGFDIRTYRLCRSVRMYHFFEELGPGATLVASLDLQYQTRLSAHPQLPTEITYLKSITQAGYAEGASKSLPPMEFGYQELKWDTTIRTITPENVVNAPIGLNNNYQWADLYGEGISGILTEQGEGWYYKYNEGGGVFTPAVLVAPKPSFLGLANGTLQLTDLDANGYVQMVSMEHGRSGYFTLTDDNEWDTYRPFEAVPEIDLRDPYLRMIDLNGDGKPDLLVTEERIFRWYPSLGTKGYAPLEVVSLDLDEESSPRIVFADPEQTIFLADMCGDGLTDIVRIRNGSVCYWPNMGYGKFGAKVEMADAPWFDHPDLFNPAYIYLADISGTGATDILYLGRASFRAWLNFSGNGWSSPCTIDPFFNTALPDKVSVVDLLGNGTSCIVWSSPLPTNAHAPMKYIDLMGGRKPHVMNFHTNHCGSETRMTYISSTQYYLADKANGHPWVTKLPFPVQCVGKKETWETVSNTYFVNEYTYHHGYYDHPEREFRGFGRVDQKDIQQFDNGEPAPYDNYTDPEVNEPPVLTKTWYHVGAYLQNQKVLDHFRHEYWPTGYLLPDAVYIGDFNNQELREAHRACKGMVLRREVYALDGSCKENLPYSVAEHNCHIKMLQPLDGNRYAVFMVQESEAITFSYERNVEDPRVSHSLNIRIDDVGNILESLSVVYPRKHRPSGLTDDLIWEVQHQQHLLLSENVFTRDFITRDVYRLRMPYETKTYEVKGLHPRAHGYFCLADLADLADIPEKRLIDRVKKLYLSDDLEHPLPQGQMDSLGLIYETYRLAVDTDLLKDTFVRNGEPLLKDIPQVLEKAGYVDLDKNGHWWLRSGRMVFEDAVPARAMFYLPRAYDDPFDARTVVKYYKEEQGYWLFINQTIDPLGNEVSILRFNFRNLSPALVRDINYNLSEVVFDERGMVTATAVRGKEGAGEGDLIDETVRPYLPLEEIQAFFEKPSDEQARHLLGHATSRQLYDYSKIPIRTATIVRETHVSDLAPGAESKLQYAFEYSDGMGNSVLKKVQAPRKAGEPRWIGSGRTVLNNKGKPVKQYEPYFSHTHLCEREDLMIRHGVSPILRYDPMGRVIRIDLPDQTFTKTRFDNWQQEIYDASDTVLDSRWYAERIGGTYDKQGKDPLLEKAAAEKAAVYAGTCSTVYLDSLGRAVVIQTFNRWQATRLLSPGEAFAVSRIRMDIKGNVLEVVDAAENRVVRYRYDLQGQTLHLSSMDAGERWLLGNCLGNPLYTWDSRGQQFYTTYDLLQRPVEVRAVTQYYAVDAPGAKELTISKIFYGGNDSESIASNLNGQPIAKYDTAGLGKTILVDFKGNVLRTSRCLCRGYKQTPDWAAATVDNPGLPMEADVYVNMAAFDALNRPVKVYAPHADIAQANILFPSYNETNLLNGLQGRLRNAEQAVVFIKAIDYDEKSQREKIVYGNDTVTRFSYDKENFRLLTLRTRKENENLQLLSYTYDPTGNVTHIRDDAYQHIYFKNQVVTPTADYTYDALYRLIKAEGREFGPQNSPVSQYDEDRKVDSDIPFPNAQELQRYTQCYAYDGVGNMLQLLHAPASGTGWRRSFTYNGHNNQLTRTTLVSADEWTDYRYDAHGNMLNIDALPSVWWDCKDRLGHADLAVGSDQQAWYTYDGTGQRMRKVVQRKNRTEETLYLGGFEVYREYQGEGDDRGELRKERETLHVMDDVRRIAIVETVTVSPSGSTQLIRYQYSNHLGSASLELDEKGEIISYEEFYPFGSTSFLLTNKKIKSAAKRYRYTGMERDEESGLNYHGARYYAPWLCRWTAADPIGIKDDLNVYSYVKNSPVSRVDTNGKWEEDMHFSAVYLSGRIAGASHADALKAAIASQSLDDYRSTKAPEMKAAGAILIQFESTELIGRIIINEANNRHSLGLTYDESQMVANEGAARHDLMLFGLGMHTVGDFLPHANLTGIPTMGHQIGKNEDGSWSHTFSTAADDTAKNPSKALSTFKIFAAEWDKYLGNKTKTEYTPDQLAALDKFIKIPTDDDKSEALKDALKPFHLSDTEWEEVKSKQGGKDADKENRVKAMDELEKDPANRESMDQARILTWVTKLNPDMWNSEVTQIPPEYEPPAPASTPPPPPPPPPDEPGYLERAYNWLDSGVRNLYGIPY